MTTDTDRLLSLARESADVTADARGRISIEFDDHGLLAFAERIRQDERERCAQICEAQEIEWDSAHNRAVESCAAAIRSSGTSKETAHV